MVIGALKSFWRTRNFLIFLGVWLLAFSPRWMPPLEGWLFPVSRVTNVYLEENAGGVILRGVLEKNYEKCDAVRPEWWHKVDGEPWVQLANVELLRSPRGRNRGVWPWGPYQLPLKVEEVGLLEEHFFHRCKYIIPGTNFEVWNPFWDRMTTILTIDLREL